MSTSVYQQIRALLDARGVSYRTDHHEPTHTSEESARARGESVRVGGKALLLKTGDVFRLFVLNAAQSLDSGALRRHFGVKKVRFARAQELHDLTGLEPGSVPPFGVPILPFPLFADPGIQDNPVIAFNAGSLTDSIILPVDDYIEVARPSLFPFAAEPKGLA